MNSNNKLDAAKAAAQAFVEQARPSDLIGLVSFNTKVEYVEPLTTDHQAVIQSIQKLKSLRRYRHV